MRALTTAGERVGVGCAVPRLLDLLAAGTGGELAEATTTNPAVHLEVQASSRPFSRAGCTVVGRGVWVNPHSTLIADACASGFDLRVEPRGSMLHVTARYRPRPATRAANVLLASRFRLLATQTLVHYPALWWASLRGRVPLHVSVTSGTGGVTMIAGPGGVGKSTLLAAGLPHGEIATADNVCACDEHTAYGLVEPLRVPAAPGRANPPGRAAREDRAGLPGRPGGLGGPAAPHGRTEVPLAGRVPALDPDRLVVLRRAAAGEEPGIRPLPAAEAARELIAGTYMAGELRRFWPFAATLALTTGLGPAHPDIAGVASALAARLPCVEIRVAAGPAVPIGELLQLAGAR
jgi:hypothetical protein